MLEEIARKKDEEAQARLEHEVRRQGDRGRADEPSPDSSPPPQGTPPGERPPQ